jgi:hypothetical protein
VTFIMAFIQQGVIEKSEMISSIHWLRFSKAFRITLILLGLVSIGVEVQFLYVKLNLFSTEIVGNGNVRMINNVVMKSIVIMYFIICSYSVQSKLYATGKLSKDKKIGGIVIRMRLLFISAFAMMIWICAGSVQLSQSFISTLVTSNYVNASMPFLFMNISDCITQTIQQIYIAPGSDLVWVAEMLGSFWDKRIAKFKDQDNSSVELHLLNSSLKSGLIDPIKVNDE